MGARVIPSPLLRSLSVLLLIATGCSSDRYGGEVVPVEFAVRWEGAEEAGATPPDVPQADLPSVESWLMVTRLWTKVEPPGPHAYAWDSSLESPTEDQVRRFREALAGPGIRTVLVPGTHEVETQEHVWVVLLGDQLVFRPFNPRTADSRKQVADLKLPRP